MEKRKSHSAARATASAGGKRQHNIENQNPTKPNEDEKRSENEILNKDNNKLKRVPHTRRAPGCSPKPHEWLGTHHYSTDIKTKHERRPAADPVLRLNPIKPLQTIQGRILAMLQDVVNVHLRRDKPPEPGGSPH